MKTKLTQLTGTVVRRGAEVLVIYKVNDKYYLATNHNSEVMDAYIHTGNIKFLKELESELE